MRLGIEVKRRYSGKLTANGNRPKKVIPMPNVESLMKSHAGMKDIATMARIRMASVVIVRLGMRHS